MRVPPDLEYLFAQPGARKWLARDRRQRPNALFPMTYKSKVQVRPGTDDFIYSTDRRILTLTETLDDLLSHEFPVDLKSGGFAGDTAVGATWHGLRNVSGIGMNPLPIPVTNNAELIRSNGLAADIRARDIPILEKVVELFFGHVAPANLHIRADGSTAFPYFTTEVKYKKQYTMKALMNIDDYLNKAVGDDRGLSAWLKDYHSIYIFAIFERQQPNAITYANGLYSSKSRTAPTPDEARSGSYSGKTYADMTVRDASGNVIEGHFAMRRRDVFGMCGIVNYVCTAIIGCFRAVYSERFAFTYKSRDRHDKAAKSAGYRYIVGSDVKTMDKVIPAWFNQRVFALLTNYLDERVVEMMRRMFSAPFVCPPPWTDVESEDDPRVKDYNPTYGGNPLDPDSLKLNVGLPSGVAFNPDWGKLWMTFVYMVFYRDCGAIYSAEEIEPLLRGRNREHALLDMSDDAVLLTNSPTVARRFQEPSSPYAILEVESPVIFLGDVFCETHSGRNVVPNPITFLVNMLCREDSVDKMDPVRWAKGYLARMQVYSSTPIFRDLVTIFEEQTRRIAGFNPYTLAKSLAKVEEFKDADAMFLADPRVIYYKLDPSEVSPEVLDDAIATIPAVDFFNRIKHLFKVPTVDYEELDGN